MQSPNHLIVIEQGMIDFFPLPADISEVLVKVQQQ